MTETGPNDGVARAATRRALLQGGAAAGTLLAAPSLAQGLSSRPVSLIVPFSPGTAPDVLARRMADAFQGRWKQTFVTENRSGASGTIGAGVVARAAPDGHTLLVTPSTFAVTPSLYRNLTYDPIKSFAPVVQLTTIGFGLLLHRSAGSDVAEFVAKAKANPGTLNYASPGPGTPHHLTMEIFRKQTGIDVMHVPASSFSSALTDLLAGRVAAMFTTITIAKSLPTDGSLKLVGVASPKRLPSVPDVPTMAELGYPGVEMLDWYAMFAPAGTPAPIVAKLNATANEILATPAVQEALAVQGMVPVGGTPEQLGALVAADIPRWAAVVRDAGIKQE